MSSFATFQSTAYSNEIARLACVLIPRINKGQPNATPGDTDLDHYILRAL